MTVTESTKTTLVYDPEGRVGTVPAHRAPSPSDLKGLRIAVLDNVKVGAREVMERAAQQIAERTGATFGFVTLKGPKDIANAATPCTEEVMQRLVTEADLVITGSADCGSCTTYSVVDTVELERRNIPAIVLTTTRFRSLTEMVATQLGLPDIRIFEVGDANTGGLGDHDLETLERWADEGADHLIELFTGKA